MDSFRKLYPVEFQARFQRRGVRPDGRELLESRKARVVCGVVSRAAGSSMVRIGQTCVVAACQARLAVVSESKFHVSTSTPSPTSEEKSSLQEEKLLSVAVELLPVCGSQHRPGKPSPMAQDLSRKVYSVLSAAKFPSQIPPVEIVNLHEVPDVHLPSLAWRLYLDIYALEDAGALLDTSVLAAQAALRNVRLPMLRIPTPSQEKDAAQPVSRDASRKKEQDEASSEAAPLVTDKGSPLTAHALPCIDPEAPGTPLPWNKNFLPCAQSFGILEGELLADPTHHELALTSATLHLVLSQDGHILLTHQPGGEPIPSAIFQKSVSLAQARCQLLQKLIEEALQDVEKEIMKE